MLELTLIATTLETEGLQRIKINLYSVENWRVLNDLPKVMQAINVRQRQIQIQVSRLLCKDAFSWHRASWCDGSI